MVIDSLLDHHFLDLDLRIEISFEKEAAAENGGVDFETGDIYKLLLEIDENFMQSLCTFLFFISVDKKIAFENSLDMYFHSYIIEFL